MKSFFPYKLKSNIIEKNMIKYQYNEIIFIEITKNLKNHKKINIYALTRF